MRRTPLLVVLAMLFLVGGVGSAALAAPRAPKPTRAQDATQAANASRELQAPATRSASRKFVHPGVFVGRGQLNLVRARVLAGRQPWKGAFDRMRASDYASLTWTSHPYEIVECGSYSNPNIGCTEEREDAMAAYTDALMWYLTRDHRYADKAIEIMDAWATTIEDHTNSNAPLQTGWAGVSWSQAGELIRYTYHGWETAKLHRFSDMLRTVYLPTVLPGKPDYNGNWELIMEEAAAGIAVFLDDHAAFDQAIAKTRARVAAYIYLESDGPLPNPPPGGTKNTPEEIVDYWQGQSTFVDGLAQETCRDFGHTGWGFDAAARTAETARIQGVPLYADIQQRLVKAYEFHAKYELGATVPEWLCGGAVDQSLGFAEVAYNHYHNRIGVSMPKTHQLIQTVIRPAHNGTDDHFIGWETLTNADNPVGRR